jgi:hypothetical protein
MTSPPALGRFPLSLLNILRMAIKAVPAVKFALGVAGIAAAAAIIFSFFKTPVAALFGTVALLVLMILLVVFAALAQIKKSRLTSLALALAWVFVVLFSLCGFLTVTSVFFNMPRPFQDLVGLFNPGERAPSVPAPSERAQEEVTIKDKTSTLASLPEIMRTPIAAGLSDSAMREKLQSHGSLTIDGGRLVVAEQGKDTGALLAVNLLRLKNGARIITNGNNLNLQANQVAVEEGGVYSFLPEDLTPHDADAGVPGRKGFDGGTLRLVSLTRVNGPLRVNLAGQNGQRGGPGSPGAPGGAGARGSNGVDGFLNCKSGGGDGGVGLPGGQGLPGAAGGDGGRGGTLSASAVLMRDIEFTLPGGKGGLGGAGGAGGAGGPGGEGGSGTVHCGGGHGGQQGPGGPPGNPGAKGNDGQDGPKSPIVI